MNMHKASPLHRPAPSSMPQQRKLFRVRRQVAPTRPVHDVTLPVGVGKLRISPSELRAPSPVSSIRSWLLCHNLTAHAYAHTNCDHPPSPLHPKPATPNPSPCSPPALSPAPPRARPLPALLPAPAAATTAPRAPSNLPVPRTMSSTVSVLTFSSTLASLASSGASFRSSKLPGCFSGERGGNDDEDEEGTTRRLWS